MEIEAESAEVALARIENLEDHPLEEGDEDSTCEAKCLEADYEVLHSGEWEFWIDKETTSS